MRVLRSVILSCGLLPATLAAQTIASSEYAARRDSLAARIDSGVVIALRAAGPRRPWRLAR